jgi:hypothetical protein
MISTEDAEYGMQNIIPASREKTPPAHFCGCDDRPEMVDSSAISRAGSTINTLRAPLGMKYSLDSAATTPLYFMIPLPPERPA